jgi:hypothetical protein
VAAGTVIGTGGSAALNQIAGGVPTAGGQISSTFEPRIVQFGLKVLF